MDCKIYSSQQIINYFIQTSTLVCSFKIKHSFVSNEQPFVDMELAAQRHVGLVGCILSLLYSQNVLVCHQDFILHLRKELSKRGDNMQN